MRWLPRRRLVLTGLLVVLVAMAGCSGGNGTGDAETTADTTAAETADEADTTPAENTATATAGSGSTDGTDGTSPSSYSYEWTEGESYTFESVADDGTVATYEWTVTDVSDGNVTAELVISSGDQEQRTTYTGPQGAIFSGTERNRYAFIFAFMQVPPRLTTGQSLSTGNSWTLSSEAFTTGDSTTEGSQEVTVDVTGTSTVAGQECYDTSASATGSNETLDACVKQDWPFALSLSISGEESGVSGSIEMTDYERP